jgi:Domain of unknown function (DUF4124)
MKSLPLRFSFQIAVLCGLGCLVPDLEAEASTSIYRCTLNGVTTFSDRPCDAAAEIHPVDTASMNTFEAPRVPAEKRTPLKRKAPRKPVVTRPDPAKQKETCDRLTRSLKNVRSTMRSGFKASEGEQLRNREDKLKAELRFAKCR